VITISMLYEMLNVLRKHDTPEDEYPVLIMSPENFIYICGDFYPSNMRTDPPMVTALLFNALTIQTERDSLCNYVARVAGYRGHTIPKPEIKVNGVNSWDKLHKSRYEGKDIWF
jgi:hypothetical protein